MNSESYTNYYLMKLLRLLYILTVQLQLMQMLLLSLSVIVDTWNTESKYTNKNSDAMAMTVPSEMVKERNCVCFSITKNTLDIQEGERERKEQVPCPESAMHLVRIREEGSTKVLQLHLIMWQVFLCLVSKQLTTLSRVQFPFDSSRGPRDIRHRA